MGVRVVYQRVGAIDRLVLVEVRGVTARHPQSGRGIAAVHLSLLRGTLTVVTGRVGAGKTTLLLASCAEMRSLWHDADEPVALG